MEGLLTDQYFQSLTAIAFDLQINRQIKTVNIDDSLAKITTAMYH